MIPLRCRTAATRREFLIYGDPDRRLGRTIDDHGLILEVTFGGHEHALQSAESLLNRGDVVLTTEEEAHRAYESDRIARKLRAADPGWVAMVLATKWEPCEHEREPAVCPQCADDAAKGVRTLRLPRRL